MKKYIIFLQIFPLESYFSLALNLYSRYANNLHANLDWWLIFQSIEQFVLIRKGFHKKIFSFMLMAHGKQVYFLEYWQVYLSQKPKFQLETIPSGLISFILIGVFGEFSEQIEGIFDLLIDFDNLPMDHVPIIMARE